MKSPARVKQSAPRRPRLALRVARVACALFWVASVGCAGAPRADARGSARSLCEQECEREARACEASCARGTMEECVSRCEPQRARCGNKCR